MQCNGQSFEALAKKACRSFPTYAAVPQTSFEIEENIKAPLSNVSSDDILKGLLKFAASKVTDIATGTETLYQAGHRGWVGRTLGQEAFFLCGACGPYPHILLADGNHKLCVRLLQEWNKRRKRQGCLEPLALLKFQLL